MQIITPLKLRPNNKQATVETVMAGTEKRFIQGEGDWQTKMIEEDRVMICESSGFWKDERPGEEEERKPWKKEEWVKCRITCT